MPHPAAYEVKHLQAPLAVSLAAAAGGGGDGQPAGEARLRLRNKQHFSDTADLALRWRVLVDGAPVAAAGSREGWAGAGAGAAAAAAGGGCRGAGRELG